MAGNDEEIKVSLTAEDQGLAEGMATGAEEVVEASNTMQSAVAESASAMAAAHATIAESADAASARIRAMVQTSLEQQSANSATAESERSLAERMGLRVEATAAQVEATKASVAAQNEQMVSTEEFLGAEAAATTTVEASTAAIVENTAVMTVNAGVARELGVLVGEGLRGNFTRMEGSVVTLGNRMGLMQAVFSPVGLAIGGVAAAAAGFTYEIYKGEQQSEAFNKALINTGGYLGVTENQFNEMAQSIVNGETTIGTAREALTAFAETGRFSGAQLKDAGQAAVDFAALTGESMDKAVAAIVKLEENPVKAITELNAQYHFLTLAQLDHIKQLEDEGDKIGAATEAIKIFEQTNAERLAQADQDVGTLSKLWRGLKADISSAGDAIQSIGRQSKDSAESQLRYAQIMQQTYQSLARRQSAAGDVAGAQEDEQAAASWGVAADKWRSVVVSQKADASDGQRAKAMNDEAVAAAAASDARLKGMKSESEYNQQLQDELANLKAIHAENANDPRLKGITFDDQGNATGGDGLAKIQAYLKKKYDAKAAAHVNEHKLDEQALQQEEADEGISYDQRLKFELEFWQQKMDAAKRGSQQYAQAYREVQNLQKQIDEQSARQADAAAKAELKTKLDAINRLKTAYDGQADVEKQQYENQYQAGQISAQRLAQLEKDLVARKLAADVAYLQAKMDLDKAAGQSGADAAQKEATAIEQAKQKAALDLSKVDAQYLQNSQRQWLNYGQQIAGSMKTAFNSMIFQGQNWKQALGSVAETAAENFIQIAVEKPMERWIAAEAVKLQTTIATLTGQATATDAQRAADATADATASVAAVTRASGVAGAQGLASFAAAPWPVDLGAPAFGAAMAMAALSYSSVASAAGGWDRVDSDQMAMIHKNEMILPAHIADFVRSGAQSASGSAPAQSSGGQGGGDHYHFHISSLDGKSTSDWLRRGGGAQLTKHFAGKSKNSSVARS
jgi:phage-related minor tail protein